MFLSIEFRFPFERKNPAGYFIAIPIQFILGNLAARHLACFLTLAFGHCLFFLAFCKDMIHCLNVTSKNGKARKKNLKILKQIIDLDSSIKMLRSFFVASNCNSSIFHVLTVTHFQIIDRFFGCLSNNNSDPFFRQHNCHLYGPYTTSNEFSSVDYLTLLYKNFFFFLLV